MCQVASLRQAFQSCLPRNAAGTSRGDQEALGASCHPPSLPRLFPSPRPTANESSDVSSSPRTPLPSVQPCEKKPPAPGQVLNRKWAAEAAGRRGGGQRSRARSQPGIGSSLSDALAFPLPQPCTLASGALKHPVPAEPQGALPSVEKLLLDLQQGAIG